MVQEAGKSIDEKNFVAGLQCGEHLALVSGTRLLSELGNLSNTPSIPIIPESDASKFFLSVFMNIDTRGGISTYDGVRQLGEYHPMSLPSCFSITLHGRFIHASMTPVKPHGCISPHVLSECVIYGILLWRQSGLWSKHARLCRSFIIFPCTFSCN